MATHHGGTGQCPERAPTPYEQDPDTLSKYHHKDTHNFESVEHGNHTTLKTLTRELDNLWHRAETAKGQPTEAINCLEHELHRLSLMLCSSAPQEPLDDVLQLYMETLCTTQKQTSFTNTLFRIYAPSMVVVQLS